MKCSERDTWEVEDNSIFIVFGVYCPNDFQNMCELTVYLKDSISEIITN